MQKPKKGGLQIKSPDIIYSRRKKVYSDLVDKEKKNIKKLSNIRLLVALMAIGNLLYLYVIKKQTFIYYILLVYIIVFIYLVRKHNKFKYNSKYLHAFYKINKNALKRLNGEWKDFKDKGSEFKDDQHSFTSDLDIFGQASLFQYINGASTHMGTIKLKDYLSRGFIKKEEILKRQEAVKELVDKLPWRQRFMAEGKVKQDKSDDRQELFEFFKQECKTYTKSWVIITARLFAVIAVATLVLFYFKLVSYKILLLVLAVQNFMFLFKIKERSKNLKLVCKYQEDIKTYRNMLHQIEKKKFKSRYILELKDKLIDKDKGKAYESVKDLERIADWTSNRSNPYFMPINILILWDYQCMIALEAWKKKSGNKIEDWLETIGEFEALSSLSSLKYDNPDWVFPEISDKPYHLAGKDIGHPLLIEDRVCNDIEIDYLTRTLLITGSNMSGKSTYLRTIGINMVLAYAGAPVCAREFSCNIFSIYTCMRTSDNLEKNISAFYAELLRIKEVLEESKTENVFFLLDEIFKGTNSYDRHQGAKIVVNKLINNNAIGLVSTHDLELEILEEESKGLIENYHFKEYYRDNKIYFDYKLRKGISTTKNAIYLMKMLGISSED